MKTQTLTYTYCSHTHARTHTCASYVNIIVS